MIGHFCSIHTGKNCILHTRLEKLPLIPWFEDNWNEFLLKNLHTAYLPSVIENEFPCMKTGYWFVPSVKLIQVWLTSTLYSVLLKRKEYLCALSLSKNELMSLELDDRLEPMLEDMNLDHIMIRMGNRTWTYPWTTSMWMLPYLMSLLLPWSSNTMISSSLQYYQTMKWELLCSMQMTIAKGCMNGFKLHVVSTALDLLWWNLSQYICFGKWSSSSSLQELV